MKGCYYIQVVFQLNRVELAVSFKLKNYLGHEPVSEIFFLETTLPNPFILDRGAGIIFLLFLPPLSSPFSLTSAPGVQVTKKLLGGKCHDAAHCHHRPPDRRHKRTSRSTISRTVPAPAETTGEGPSQRLQQISRSHASLHCRS